MPNELPIPEELKHLIEKRTGDDRREVRDSEGDERRRTDRRGAPSQQRPGDVLAVSGRCRCRTCGSVTNHIAAGDVIPTCSGCGNQSEPWFQRIERDDG